MKRVLINPIDTSLKFTHARIHHCNAGGMKRTNQNDAVRRIQGKAIPLDPFFEDIREHKPQEAHILVSQEKIPQNAV